ncbi:MAG TPA: CDP-alcohol phosphatidyltransferase [Paludibacteraceae bacterium]|nr:CDP-alcohol phosphatidyltransferase family protein [Paludibacteraceae bacterium]HOL00398.1 CDP-alcohol phosphatidyltransferase [Paludibacteraceae bacterium]
MGKIKDEKQQEIVKTISEGRTRTNLLRKYEQSTLAYLVQRIPAWMSSDMLTAIGFFGSVIVFLSFVLAAYVNRYLLLIGVLGFVISWFGDSLDGRVAYYRHKPRKWYGFSLDITVDWLGVILMGAGFIVYAISPWKIIGFLFVGLYGWEMITALLRYKIINQYSIDSGAFGPTEVRILISLILVLEVIFKNSIIYTSSLACLILLIMNILETKKILQLADERDKNERGGEKI